MRKHFKISRIALVFALLLIVGAMGYGKVATNSASAGPEIVGNPDGAEYRALLAPAGGKVKRVVYVAAGAHTMAGANTPVVGDAQCGFGSFTLFRADMYLTGTMTGTAPTLAIKWQHSIDGGVNWIDVGTWTTVNATVTPASQSQTVSDIYNATTPVAYGDCWRANYTMGGTGTVTANFEVAGYAK